MTPRPLTLFSEQGPGVPPGVLAAGTVASGYGVPELACRGDHSHLPGALADPPRVEGQRELLVRDGLGC